MKRRGIIVTALSCLILGACSNSVQVGADFNESIDFTAYRSYRWHETNEYNLESMRYLNSELTDARIRGQVDGQLAAKGIRLRENGPVDFLVNYTVTGTDAIDIDTYNTYSGYAPGWGYGYGSLGPYRYGGIGYGRGNTGGTETRITEYVQGTFVLDFVESASDKLVWRGIAEGKIDPSASQAERQENTIDVVQRVLADFPPGSGE